MNEEDRKPCDHAGCGCKVALSVDFCSESCRFAAESQMVAGACECGHAACQQRQ